MVCPIRVPRKPFATCTACGFAGLDLAFEAVRNETTILNFRHLPQAHDLTKVLFEAVCAYLRGRSLMMRGGSIMGAALISAASSTRNKASKRDPDMSQTKRPTSDVSA